MLKVGLNFMRDARKGLNANLECQCHCDVYSSPSQSSENIFLAPSKVYKGITQFWQECVCEKSKFEEWHKWGCLIGDCENCAKVNNLPLCLIKLVGNIDYKVLWRCFETKIVGQVEDGQLRKQIREVFKETSIVNFLTYLKPNLQKIHIT